LHTEAEVEAEALTKKAIAYAKNGENPSGALKLFKRACHLQPNIAKYHVNLGQMILRTMVADASTFKKKFILLRKAEKKFRKALEIQPNYARAEKNLQKQKRKESSCKNNKKFDTNPSKNLTFIFRALQWRNCHGMLLCCLVIGPILSLMQ